MVLKKRLKILLCISIPLLILTIAVVVAIAIIFSEKPNDDYISKYQLDKCDVLIQEPKNDFNNVNFDLKYEIENSSLYFDTKTFNAKEIDETIDIFSEFKDLFDNKSINSFPNCIYASVFTFDSWEDDNGLWLFSMPNNTSKEEILAWLLYFSQERSNSIEGDSTYSPYGLYAGISSYWLQIPKYQDFIPSSIDNAGCLTDLQFPLYEQNNLSEKARNYAWSFSTYLVKSMLSYGKTESEILSINRASLEAWLKENFNLVLPSYSFEPYSTQYEYKVKQDCFTYYINKEYNDLVLPVDVFSTKYDLLTDWLKDNDKTTKESNDVFGISEMYDINVYLEDGFKSKGITGYAYKDHIDMYSVGSFSHEYIHHILFKRNKGGYFREVFPELHANTSKYAMAMWYYLFTGQAKNFPYGVEDKEKETYLNTLELYKKYSGEAPSVDNLNFWLFADCFSAIYTEKNTRFISRLQGDSLIYYIARVYGPDYAWLANMHPQMVFDGKSVLEVEDEWFSYIKSLNK